MSWVIIKIKIKKLDGDYNYFNLMLRTCCFFQKIFKMLKTSMWDYEKSSMVTYPFYLINWQALHKTSCMQRIKKILVWEVLPAIALVPLSFFQKNKNADQPLHLCFCLILYVPVNNFSVMSGQVFLALTSTKQRIKCLAQGHNAVPPVRLEPTTPQSWVKPPHSSLHLCSLCLGPQG